MTFWETVFAVVVGFSIFALLVVVATKLWDWLEEWFR